MATKDGSSKTSLRNPLAALANSLDLMAEQEPNPMLRAGQRRQAEKARAAARKQPPPK